MPFCARQLYGAYSVFIIDLNNWRNEYAGLAITAINAGKGIPSLRNSKLIF
jgi:hypothetical protein